MGWEEQAPFFPRLRKGQGATSQVDTTPIWSWWWSGARVYKQPWFVWGLAPWHDASQVSQRLSRWKAWWKGFKGKVWTDWTSVSDSMLDFRDVWQASSLSGPNISSNMTRAWNLEVSRDLLMRFLWGLQRVKQVFLPVTVTTRIIVFLVGDPYKPSFTTVTGRGDNPNHRCPSTLSSVLSKIRKMHADENCVCQHENSVSSHCHVIQSHIDWWIWAMDTLEVVNYTHIAILKRKKTQSQIVCQLQEAQTPPLQDPTIWSVCAYVESSFFKHWKGQQLQVVTVATHLEKQRSANFSRLDWFGSR